MRRRATSYIDPQLQARMAIAQNLRTWRDRTMSQTAAARALGISRSYYVDMEHGRSPLPAELIPQVRRVFGMPSADELFREPKE